MIGCLWLVLLALLPSKICIYEPLGWPLCAVQKRTLTQGLLPDSAAVGQGSV
jgi:hypothetical protein